MLSQGKPVVFSELVPTDKRRQSDLFNILMGLSVIESTPTKAVIWKGMNYVTDFLIKIGITNEIKAINCSPKEIFGVKDRLNLGDLAEKFISLYVFLGVDRLNIRHAVNLMADSPSQIQKVLRRLYSVVFILEQIGVVRHLSESCHYLLQQPIELIVAAVFQEVPKLHMFPAESIEALLNRFNDVYIKTLHKKRHELYLTEVERT